MRLNFNTRDPVYMQVIRQLKTQIATGELKPGQAIPSRRELANTLKINPNTAQRAYKDMEEQGLIRTESNLPSTITSDETVITRVREELLETAADQFIETIRPIDVPLEELLELIRKKYMSPDDKKEGPAHD